MAKATHKGTCQVCGAVQKLPRGRLAAHGYTTKWGFFSGTCSGSHHLPFEQSKNLIDSCIVSAQASIDSAAHELVELAAQSDVCHIRQYINGKWQWSQVPKAEIIETSPNRYVFAPELGTLPKRVGRQDIGHHSNKTVESAIIYHNNTDHGWRRELENRIKDTKQYVDWQTERARAWTEQELLPIK